MPIQTIADWRGAVIDNRKTPLIADYIPEEHRRRMQCADVLCKYLAGASKECYLPGSLSDSMSENWVDTALVFVLSEAIARLVLLGFQVTCDDDEQADAFNRWLRRSRALRALRQAERVATAAGDSVLVVRWDPVAKAPRLDVYLPGMYLPLSPDSAVLFWSRPEARYRDRLFVEHYTVGIEAQVTGPGEAQVTGRTMAGVKSGWVSLEARTAMGNTLPLQDRLGDGTFQPLGVDRLPIVHIPTGETDMDGWGTSDFWQALGLVDMYNELMADRRKGARFLQPPMIVWGDRPPLDAQNKPALKYQPNSLYHVGEAGGMSVPDFSNLLKATHDEQNAVWSDILFSTGLCKAMMGDVGDVSNRRDREVRLMYLPGQTKIRHRREERMEFWHRVLGLIADVWRYNDKAGYTARMKDADPAAMEIALDEVLPEDVAEMINTLTVVKNAGGLDRETYAGQALDALGVAGDAAEIAKRAASEEQSGLGLGSWPQGAGAE